MLISMKRIKDFDDGSKKAKYVWLLVIACFVMPICNGQSKGINDYTTATWNTRSDKWNDVPTVLNIPMLMDSGVEVLALQEARKKGIDCTLPTNSHSIIDIVLNNQSVLPNIKMGINEFPMVYNGNNAHAYLFNRVSYNEALNLEKVTKCHYTQFVGIVSRYSADKVILLEEIRTGNICKKDKKTRPVLGIVIGKAVFFSLHAASCVNQNEAPDLIIAIQNYMDRHHADKSWIAMGDFNSTPDVLQRGIGNAPTGKFRQIISTVSTTHGSYTYDYAVVGGPDSYYRSPSGVITVPTASLLLPTVTNPSDHKPVKFN